jgi:hypothetical protein
MIARKFRPKRSPVSRQVDGLKAAGYRREDVLTEKSSKAGLEGFFETLMRRFRNLSFVLLLSPLALVCCACLGLAAAPGLYWFNLVVEWTASWPAIFRYVAMGFGLASGYLIYGISLLFIIPTVNLLVPRVKPFRGPWFSLPSVPWFIHNGLTYIVRWTFLEFVTPSPLNILFYRMMGMKIGKGVVINTTHISDPSLITLEDYVTVGGSATIFAHYGQKGYLVIAPVTVGRGTNIGLKASIMGGATIGQNVTIKPHSAILPKMNIPDGETV